MARYSAILSNQLGAPVASALVYAKVSTTGVPAVLTDDGGNTLDQPFPTAEDGSIIFNTPDNLIDLSYYLGGRRIGRDLGVIVGNVSTLPAGSVANFLGSSTNVAPSQAAVTGALNSAAAALAGGAGSTLVSFLQGGSGALIRNLQDRLRDVVSVLDFISADPSGATDSFAAINSAVTFLTIRGGGTLIYPAGTYLTSASIPDVQHVMHQGAGINATTVKSGGNYPTFARAGSDTVTINCGGVRDMTVRGSWNQAGPSANNQANGLNIIGSNGAVYENLRLLNCYIAIYLSHNYESRMNNISILGEGTDQSNIGVVFDVADSANVNNAMYMQNVVSSFTALDGWRIFNGNGSDFVNCSAEANGGYGFIIGSGMSLVVPSQFMQFTNCTADTSGEGNWLIQADALADLRDVQFNNCWAGTAGSANWEFVNAMNCTLTGCVGYSAQKEAMRLENSSIQVAGFIGKDYNASGLNFAGLNLLNTNEALITACDLSTSTLGTNGRSLDENGTSNFNNIHGNKLLNGAQILGANTMIRNNRGFVTESSAVAAVPNGSTSVSVTHGLSIQPSIGEISLTPQSNCNAWVTGITGTAFTLNVSVSTGVTVGWQATITRH